MVSPGAFVGLEVVTQMAGMSSQYTSGTAFFDGVRQEINKVFPMFIPDVQHLLTLRHRGLIEDKDFFDMMKKQGYSDFRATQLFEVSKQLPSIQDQVKFVVKEGYSPELIADLTKGEPMPVKFGQQMKRIGVEQGADLLYWSTHYDPLGRGEFEEMFHRLNPTSLKFKQETLKKLGLKAEDVSFDLAFLKRMYRIKDVYPGLRDRLAVMSYKPITRIDVRRLEDFGFLTKEELVFRNTEIGYSPEDAELLARWTLINNALIDIRPALRRLEMSFEEAQAELIKIGATPQDALRIIERIKPTVKKARVATERDLTKGEYIKAYKKEMITRSDAASKLLALNYDKDEAEFLLDLADLEIEVASKKKAEAEEKKKTAAKK